MGNIKGQGTNILQEYLSSSCDYILFLPQKAKLNFSFLLPPTPETTVQAIHQSNDLPEKARLSKYMVLQSSQGDFCCFFCYPEL